MLNSLREFSTVEAIGILSHVGGAFTSDNPLEDSPTEAEPISFQGVDVLAEIRRRLSIDSKDNSREARDKILFFISGQLSEIALRGVDENKIKSRLASKRILRPDLYDISIDVMDWIGTRGIRRKQIHDAINYADSVEHVPLDMGFLHNSEELSFFVHHIQSDDPAHRFSLLVVASREGFKIEVRDAIRIYPREIFISVEARPIDLLRSFLDRYGLVMTIGKTKSKFILLAKFDKSKIVGNEQSLIEWESKNDEYFRTVVATKNSLYVYDVAIAYSVNESTYKHDLRAHGVGVG